MLDSILIVQLKRDALRNVMRWCSAVCICLGLLGCQGNPPHYLSVTQGYGLDYPAGWEVVTVEQASPGVDVVIRDLVERTANLSVIVNPIAGPWRNLTELGTPTDVGYRFFQEQQARLQKSDSPLVLAFLGADTYEQKLRTYYTLEYAVTFPDGQQQHNLASAIAAHGKLFTCNLALPERFWRSSPQHWRQIVESFALASV